MKEEGTLAERGARMMKTYMNIHSEPCARKRGVFGEASWVQGEAEMQPTSELHEGEGGSSHT